LVQLYVDLCEVEWTFLMLTIHAYYAFIVDLLLSFCMVFLFKVTIEHIKDLLRDCWRWPTTIQTRVETGQGCL